MECKNCFSEFKIDKSSTRKIINCPYCNIQLVNPNQMYSSQVDKNQTKSYKNAKEVLMYIKEIYGMDIFSDVNRINNLFNDLAPNLYKEREVIKRAFIEGINILFLQQAKKDYKKEEDIVVKKTLRILKEELCIIEHTAVMLVECFSCVFDFKISISDIYKYSKEINKENEKFDIDRDCNEEWYVKGKAELKAGDYVGSFNSFTVSAKQGNVLSKATLGIFYYRGIGCERDYEEAIKWFRNAHMNECALGKAWLSFAYKSGIIVTKNDELSKKMQREVFESMEILANYGNDDAQCFLGIAYYIGECVTQDYKKSFYWFLKSSENGNLEAQKNLALSYEYGRGVIKNKEKAFELYQKSANKGYMVAQAKLVNCYSYGIGVEPNQKKAFEWCKRAAMLGDKYSQYNLAMFYQNGTGVELDESKAFKWMKKAAEQGDNVSEYNLGIYYASGLYVDKNYDKAFEWFLKAAKQGNVMAQNNVGYYYQKGLGVEKNELKAIEWYTKSAEHGYDVAQNNLAFCYQYGIGVSKNKTKAMEWFSKSKPQLEETLFLEN